MDFFHYYNYVDTIIMMIAIANQFLYGIYMHAYNVYVTNNWIKWLCNQTNQLTDFFQCIH